MFVQRVVWYLYSEVRLWFSYSAPMSAEAAEISHKRCFSDSVETHFILCATFRLNLLGHQCCAAYKKRLIRIKSLPQRKTCSGVKKRNACKLIDG